MKNLKTVGVSRIPNEEKRFGNVTFTGHKSRGVGQRATLSYLKAFRKWMSERRLGGMMKIHCQQLQRIENCEEL